jgi:hypothetical protein
MAPPRTIGDRRGGFTLVEVLVVNILLALLVVLIAGAWRAFGPLCIEVIARGRIVNEANIAAAALYHETNNRPNGLIFAKVETTDEASLQFDYSTDGSVPSNGNWPYVVVYSLQRPQGNQNSTELLLVRSDGTTSVTIARHLESAVAHNIQVNDPTGAKSQAEFTLSFAYRGSRSQYTFLVQHQPVQPQ